MERQKAYNYLYSHYNSMLGLIYESEDTGTHFLHDRFPWYNLRYNQSFWIISDNFLAYQAVSSYNSTLSNQIHDTVYEYINRYNIYPPFLYEVLYGEDIPDTIHISEQHVLEITSSYAILTDRHNGTNVMDDWDQYGDLLVYKALDYYWSGNNMMAKYCYKKAYDMFDGKGVYDIATEKDGVYVNYKLALLIYASRILELDWDKIPEIEARLWSTQNPITGGITTLADMNGTAIGSANCETTALALIAYNEALIQSLIGGEI